MDAGAFRGWWAPRYNTWTSLIPQSPAPIASAIARPSPVAQRPLVVGNLTCDGDGGSRSRNTRRYKARRLYHSSRLSRKGVGVTRSGRYFCSITPPEAKPPVAITTLAASSTPVD